jgi:hypothetical protein
MLDAIPHPLLLVEQAGLKGAKLAACISKFEIENLDMPNPTTSTAVVSFAIKLFLRYQDVTANPVLPAGEYAGSFPGSFSSFDLIYDAETRGGLLVGRLWAAMSGKLGDLKLTDGSSKDPGIDEARQLFSDFTQSNRDDLMKRAVSTEESIRIDQSRQDLLDIADIGLNNRLRSVSDLSRFLSASDTLSSASQIADQMITKGVPLAILEIDFDRFCVNYKSALQTVEQEKGFLPVPNLIEQRLAELAQLRDIRALLPAS